MLARKNFTVRVSEEELSWLQTEAKRQGRSIANLIIFIITEYMKKERKEEPGNEHNERNL